MFLKEIDAPTFGYVRDVQRIRAHVGRIVGGLPAAAVLVVVALGCQAAPTAPVSFVAEPDRHTWFAVGPGAAHALGSVTSDGTVQCQSCHPLDATSFKQINCLGCHTHEQTVTARLHATVTNYRYGDSNACYQCHTPDKKVVFDHAGISNDCARCHDVGAVFAALPRANFNHPSTGGGDCSGCHNTSDWAKAAGAPNAHDPAHDIMVVAQLATFAGTSMVAVTAQTEKLPMVMNHGSADVSPDVLSDCASCHPNLKTTGYFSGVLHASLAALGAPQPTACVSCHADTMPTGFVGPAATSPVRVPSSGEMRHEAVAWANDVPSTTRMVTTNCGACHRGSTGPNPTGNAAWSVGKDGAPVTFHAALAAAAFAQPTSCIDCHANSRPAGGLGSANAALPAGVTFDHSTPAARGDCATCHAAGAAPSYTSWRLGKLHLAGAASPPSCLPCHAGERPMSTASWISTTYKSAPFDYVPSSATGTTHGDGQDCAQCHAGPGTGAWGGTQNWVGGRFAHGPGSHADDTCVACHSTQRPDLRPGTTPAAVASMIGFDHAANGTGECIGCHAATVAAGRYTNYLNPATWCWGPRR